MNGTATLLLADVWSMHGDVGAGWWIVMALVMVAFWGAVIFGGAYLLRGNRERRADEEKASELLERRLAAGEISVEEYRERRDALSEDGTRSERPSAADPA